MVLMGPQILKETRRVSPAEPAAPIIGAPAPAFSLPATGQDPEGAAISLGELAGRRVVLWFYPRDATPGCTTEGGDFRDAHADFEAANAVVLGVSRDSLASHRRFKAAESMPFELLSDEPGDACRAYGVLVEKNVHGRTFEGIERSTFLIDERGVLVREWRKVAVPGHAAEVLAAVRAP